MKVVIDTDVLVSSLSKIGARSGSSSSSPGIRSSSGSFPLKILEEYRRVLARPKIGLPPELLQEWSRLLDSLTRVVEVETRIEFPRDAKEAPADRTGR